MLETLESASCNAHLDPAASSSVLEQFTEHLAKLSANADGLRRHAAAELPSRRQVWKARVRDVEDQIGELQSGQARCAAKLRLIQRDNAMRRELLQRHTSISMASPTAESRVADESKRMDSSTSMAGSILATGKDTLRSLVGQRDTLRGTRRKVLDVLNQAGIDQGIIRRIERRDRADMLLVYALMALLLVCLGLAVAWKYYRKAHS